MHQTPRRAATRAKVAPLEAARRVKILFFGMLIMYGEGFFTTRDFSGYRDWPQSNAEITRRRGRSTFPSVHCAARPSAAQLAV